MFYHVSFHVIKATSYISALQVTMNMKTYFDEHFTLIYLQMSYKFLKNNRIMHWNFVEAYMPEFYPNIKKVIKAQMS